MLVYTLEQRWEILQPYFCRFWQKKIILSDETHFDLGGYVNTASFYTQLWDLQFEVASE